MRLSILIPVYRVADYLPDLLHTLTASLPPAVEVVFFDDASPEHEADIIAACQRQHPQLPIRLVCSPHNVGLTRARAVLLANTEADYVWFIDSDDVLVPGAVQAVMQVLDEQEPDVLLFDYAVFHDGSTTIKRQERLNLQAGRRLPNHHHVLYRKAVQDGKHYFWNKVFKRERICGVVAFEIPAFEDIAYTPILLDQCQSYYYLPQTLLHYRIRSNSIAQSVGKNQIQGLAAYLQQAAYCRERVGDAVAYAYLLYKVVIYYYRMADKIRHSALPGEQRQEMMQLLEQAYAHRPLGEQKIAILLLRQGMVGKALKLMFVHCQRKLRS